MEPDKDKLKDKDRKAARQGVEVAYYTKELGRSLQRKLLQRQLADFSDSSIMAANHGEEPAPDWDAPPREDRAG